jgi:hypothetical protein
LATATLRRLEEYVQHLAISAGDFCIQKGPIVSKGELKVLRNEANGPDQGASRDRSAGRRGGCKLATVDDARSGGH